jgi:hypothetical protein
MAAMHKQLVVSLADLRYISVECKNCSSSVTLDMTKVSDHQRQYGFTPAVCPACRNNYDTAVKNINQLRDAYDSLLCVADQLTLRGDTEAIDINASVFRASSVKD